MIDVQQLHFLRPLWLLAAVPAVALAIALWRQPGSGANWRRAIAADLLEHLLESSRERRNGWPWLALLGWLLATLALAGPTWEKLPQPVLQKRDALAIVLDLSLSMYAEDVKPSRLQRARFKLLDALGRRNEGLTGLVVYSGDAHVVSPLTDDTATIANLVPSLAPTMMPVYGSDPVAGIDQALQLLRNAGFERGRILLVSDEITAANIDAIAQRLDGGGQWQLSILGVGTDQGAPIPVTADNNRGVQGSAGGGFLKQPDGQIVVAQLHRERFTQLAQRTGGLYSDLHADDRDLDALLPAAQPREGETRAVQREFDQWRERGPWLAMALLPLAALAFRRGWLLLLLVLPLTLPMPAAAQPAAGSTATGAPAAGSPAAGAPAAGSPAAGSPAAAPPSTARSWRDWWQRPDQQGQQALDAGDAKGAAEKFQDPAHRGAAQYRAGDYAAAAQTLRGIDDADAHYNRGNALARAGHLQEAIAAYDAALAKAPGSADAKANRELVEKLLKQQQQNPQNDGQQGQQQNQQQDRQQSDSSKQDRSGQQNESSQQNGQSGQQNESGQRADGKSGDDASQQNQARQDSSEQNPSKQDGTQKNGSAADQRNADGKQDASAARAQEEQARAAEQAKQQAAQQQDGKAGDKRQTAASDEDREQQQQQRATEQWLRQIPDDPAGLLRRKFLYEHRQRERSAPPRDNEQPLW